MKISIIIPVYNAEKFLVPCLNSCIDQEPFAIGEDYEIICVDDGSNDRSAVILEEYKAKGITVITQQNSGVSIARNKGMGIAKGEYVWFVDSDDLIRPNILPQIYNELVKANADGCTLKIQYVAQVYKYDKCYSLEKLTFDKAIAHMQNAFMIIVRRNYINEHNIRFKEGMAYGEDTLFMYDLRLYGHKFINCPNVLYFYRQVNTSAMHKKNATTIEKSLNASMVMLSTFKNVLDNWNPRLYTGDAMTEERYYWTVQNILFTILRIDKNRRNEIFKRLQYEGHYPYPIQLKRFIVDSGCFKAYLINGFCLLFPIKTYYKLISIIFGK